MKKAPAPTKVQGAFKDRISGADVTPRFLTKEDQQAKILNLLTLRPHTSYELRRAGCYQCPTRVLELRRQGYRIDTARVTVVDQDGFEHPRVALYSLAAGPNEVQA